MSIFWEAPLSKTVRILDDVNGHELYFYGVTIGWLGLGIVVGKKRQLTMRPADGACTCGLSDDDFHPREWHKSDCPKASPRR